MTSLAEIIGVSRSDHRDVPSLKNAEVGSPLVFSDIDERSLWEIAKQLTLGWNNLSFFISSQ
jgi:hypothetical protein